MNLRRYLTALTPIVMSLLTLSMVSTKSLANAPSEEEAMLVAEEVRVMISVGTGIVGSLQTIINAGNPDPEKVDKSQILDTFKSNYAHVTGAAFDADSGGLLGESRRAFVASLDAVLEDHTDVIAEGGVDAFVPAYFRSEVFAEFNERLGGRVKGYATNREEDLLNPDWSIDALMDYSLFAYYIQELLEEEQKKPLLKSVAGRVVGYYPMKLKQSCVSCHARQGLDQEVGEFGGALITEVLLEH